MLAQPDNASTNLGDAAKTKWVAINSNVMVQNMVIYNTVYIAYRKIAISAAAAPTHYTFFLKTSIVQ